jgi:tRNA G10  N-methylase Trm11
MNETLLEWRRYKYFPYERDFARLEAERLFRSDARDAPTGLRFPAASFDTKRAERLTYFARAIDAHGEVVVPHQARLEASASEGEHERQATRYSAHGLHEYKGKFNPQVVRAIGNMLGLSEGARVLDPFCGSGTTLLECAHAGWDALGVDRNPLATQIANAKVRSLRRVDALQDLGETVVRALDRYRSLGEPSPSVATIEKMLGPRWSEELPSFEYLAAWFPLPVLAQVVSILRLVRRLVDTAEDRAVFEVILSDHLRDASLQDPGDLRIRRRKDAARNYPLIEWFAEATTKRVARVARARRALGAVSGRQRAVLADIRSMDWKQAIGNRATSRFDAIITSPPYETALPYVDTQRLSLVLFGHLRGDEVQATERALIGARDVGTVERRQLEDEIREGTTDVPRSVLELCRELLAAASRPGNGFRRVARPALVLRYFKSMALFFRSIRRALRPGGYAALVVGTNRTTLANKEFVIDTPRLLADVGVHMGLNRDATRRMDTYPRYDLHQKNSIESEMLIVLQAT